MALPLPEGDASPPLGDGSVPLRRALQERERESALTALSGLSATTAPARPTGLRLVDDDDGVYFYGSGSFHPPQSSLGTSTAAASEPAAAAAAEPAAALADPSAAAVAAAAVPPRSKGPAWNKVVASNLPLAPPQALQLPSASGAAAPAPQISTAAAAGAPLCSFFARGACRAGARCRFRHEEAAAPWAVEFFEGQLAAMRRLADGEARPVAAAEEALGLTSAGADDTVGGDDEDDAAAFAASAAVWQEGALGSRSTLLDLAVASGVCGSLAEAEVALQAAERAASADLECGVCLEVVLSQAGRRFGLLSGCEHTFCLDCIRAWRARIDLPKSTTRSCPVCRTCSYFVIACDRFVSESSRKAALNADYSRATHSIPCRHFNYGRGECPFGSSCFYAHLNMDGTPAHASGAHGFRLDADGKVSGAGGKRHLLADFLG